MHKEAFLVSIATVTQDGSPEREDISVYASKRILLYKFLCIKVYYYHTREIYEIKIASKTVIRFFTTGQLEIDWKNKDRTIVFPSGVRYEIFQPFGTEIFHMEWYVVSLLSYCTVPHEIKFSYDSYIDLANMKMRVFDASGKGQELVPDTKYMSIRVDNSYVAVIGEHLHIYGPDFKVFLM